MRTHVVCLGNELVGDDGVGIRVGRVLQGLPLPGTITVELVANLGFGLLDALERAEHLVIVDAMDTGRPAGTCVVSDAAGVRDNAAPSACCHMVGIADVIGLARQLSPSKVASAITIVGIEGQRFFDFGTELSPEVAAALAPAVDKVLELASADEPLRAKARALCAEIATRPPTLAELCNLPSPVD